MTQGFPQKLVSHEECNVVIRALFLSGYRTLTLTTLALMIIDNKIARLECEDMVVEVLAIYGARALSDNAATKLQFLAALAV